MVTKKPEELVKNIKIKMGNKFVSPGVYVQEKDINIWPPPGRRPFYNAKWRRKKISNIFNLGYEDPLDNPQVLWGSNTYSPRKTFTIPVGPPNSPEMIKSIDELIEKYK